MDHRGDRLHTCDGPTTSDRHWEQGRRMSYPVSSFVENVLARVDLTKMLGNNGRYFRSAWIEAVDDDSVETHGLGEERAELRLVVPRLCFEREIIEVGHFVSPALLDIL